MQVSLLLARQIIQLFLILLMGYATVKAGLLKASDSKVISVLMVYLVCPCMILNAFQIRKGLVYAMILAAAMHVVLLAVTALLRRPLKLDMVEQVNTIYSNAGALVIPLVQALLGSEYVIYSCAFIIVQTVLIWTHGNACLQGSFSFEWKKLLENVNILAILAGMLLYFLHLTLPEMLQNTVNSMGSMIGPIGMLLAGMAIAESWCARW